MCIECSSKNQRRSMSRIPQCEFYFGRGGPSPPHMRSLGLDFPALVKEWNYPKNGNYTPYNISPHSHERAHWLCKKCGLPYDTFIFSRTSKKPSGCPYCAGQKPIPYVNDLFSRHRKLVEEWDWERNEKGPAEYCEYSSKKVYWICSYCKYSYPARIVNRTYKGTGCPCCSGNKVVPGRNDLLTTHEDIAKEWDYDNNNGTTPYEYSYGSNKRVYWICPQKHSYPAVIKNRTIKGEGCPVCANKKVVKGENDLASTQSHIAAEWDYEKNGMKKPDQYTYGSDEYAWWICPTEKHSYWQKIVYRTSRGYGCPCIFGKKVYEEQNSLQAVYPNFVREWDWKNNDKFPSQYTAYSNQEVYWICPKCQGSYPARIDNRTLKGDGCPYCTNKELLIGVNDLQTRVDGITALWDYTRNELFPSQVIATVNAKAYLFCSQGHSYEATINGKTSEISRCPYCNKKLPIVGETDLLSLHQELCERYDRTKNKKPPELCFADSPSVVSWICDNNHSFRAPIREMVMRWHCKECDKERRKSRRHH